jgi:hypothetical protein
VSALPLKRPTRNRWRRLLTHEQYRLRQHFGYIDPRRIELGRASVGAASWCHMFGELFGDPYVVLNSETARVIKFPARWVNSGSSDGCC